jgi:hypothetical protein
MESDYDRYINELERLQQQQKDKSKSDTKGGDA